MNVLRGWSAEQVREYTAGRVFSDADSYILQRLEKNSPDTVVEIGCGPGIIAGMTLFARKYICTDITFDFLKVAFETASNCLFINCSDDMPLPDSLADCVLAMVVLHHLPKEALRPSLYEIHRILKPGGIFLLLEDWCFQRGTTGFEEEARRWRFRNGSDENHLAAEEWSREIKSAGFSCADPVWVERPFHTSASHFTRWPEEERKVRMMALESVRQ